ncbi:MAG TPA: ubiquinol-cytochrome c reductase iron-sulfur subunit [Chromatiales bacterium]|nr:ubiquinol-cytochrome c reductase iron-sulfur subunit [Chromatiales bacterium]
MSASTDVGQVPPEHDEVDKSKRRFLIGATSAVGAVGTAALLIPFVSSMAPSERAKAAGAPVEADIGKLEFGQQMSVEWRGKPVWVVRRTEEMLKALKDSEDGLKDPRSEVLSQQPSYAKNVYRSIKPEYLIVVGICTHLGCSPTFRPEIAPADLGSEWKGGWYCPCHGSRFDLAGRVTNNSPAGTNLVIPAHSYLSESQILIGVDQESA